VSDWDAMSIPRPFMCRKRPISPRLDGGWVPVVRRSAEGVVVSPGVAASRPFHAALVRVASPIMIHPPLALGKGDRWKVPRADPLPTPARPHGVAPPAGPRCGLGLGGQPHLGLCPARTPCVHPLRTLVSVGRHPRRCPSGRMPPGGAWACLTYVSGAECGCPGLGLLDTHMSHHV
jgi:hypothetical protein